MRTVKGTVFNKATKNNLEFRLALTSEVHGLMVAKTATLAFRRSSIK
jgi:hypothetical protein